MVVVVVVVDCAGRSLNTSAGPSTAVMDRHPMARGNTKGLASHEVVGCNGNNKTTREDGRRLRR